jgi:hypothetical protein
MTFPSSAIAMGKFSLSLSPVLGSGGVGSLPRMFHIRTVLSLEAEARMCGAAR